MKNLIVAFSFMLIAAGAAAVEYPVSFIGLSADEELTTCAADIVVNQYNTVYVVVYVRPEINGVRGGEFCIQGLPAGAQLPNAIFRQTWFGPTVGEVETGLGVNLTYPVSGSIAVLGTIEWYVLNPSWIGADHLMTVAESQDNGALMITDLHNIQRAAYGGQFTFNCSNPEQCDCRDDDTALAPTSWSSVKALY